jgi:hypothetical protein
VQPPRVQQRHSTQPTGRDRDWPRAHHVAGSLSSYCISHHHHCFSGTSQTCFFPFVISISRLRFMVPRSLWQGRRPYGLLKRMEVSVGVARAEGIRAYHYGLASFTSIAEQQSEDGVQSGITGLHLTSRHQHSAVARDLRSCSSTPHLAIDEAVEESAIDEGKGTAIPIVDATLTSTKRWSLALRLRSSMP